MTHTKPLNPGLIGGSDMPLLEAFERVLHMAMEHPSSGRNRNEEAIDLVWAYLAGKYNVKELPR